MNQLVSLHFLPDQRSSGCKMYQPSYAFPFSPLMGIRLQDPNKNTARGRSHASCNGIANADVANSVGSSTPEAAIILILQVEKVFQQLHSV